MNAVFYQQRHAIGDYGQGHYDVESLLKEKAVSKWIVSHSGRFDVLDVGCGQGLFLRQLLDGLRLRCMVCNLAIGIDLVDSVKCEFKTARFKMIICECWQGENTDA